MDQNLLIALLSSFSGLLGAALGVFATVKAVEHGYILQRKDRDEENHKRLVKLYLVQLSETIYSLKMRQDNLTRYGGKYVMTPDYFTSSTLYILGSVWAYERILLFDGIYYELDRINKGSGTKLFSLLKEFSKVKGFYRYDLLSLAEMLIEYEGDKHRVLPYVEFKHRLQDPFYQETMKPAVQWLQKSGEIDQKSILPLIDAELKRLLISVGEFDKYSLISDSKE